MTPDIRTAAQREAEKQYPPTLMALHGGAFLDHNEPHREVFASGAVWGAERVTPTREQIEQAILGRTAIQGAKAVLALMQELAERA